MGKPCIEAIEVAKALPGLEHETHISLQVKNDKHVLRIDGIEVTSGLIKVEMRTDWAWPMVFVNGQRVLYRTTVMRNGALLACDPGLLREREAGFDGPPKRLEHIEMLGDPLVLGDDWKVGLDS